MIGKRWVGQQLVEASARQRKEVIMCVLQNVLEADSWVRGRGMAYGGPRTRTDGCRGIVCVFERRRERVLGFVSVSLGSRLTCTLRLSGGRRGGSWRWRFQSQSACV